MEIKPITFFACVFKDGFFSKVEKHLISFKCFKIFQYLIWELALITKTAISGNLHYFWYASPSSLNTEHPLLRTYLYARKLPGTGCVQSQPLTAQQHSHTYVPHISVSHTQNRTQGNEPWSGQPLTTGVLLCCGCLHAQVHLIRMKGCVARSCNKTYHVPKPQIFIKIVLLCHNLKKLQY